MLYMKCLIRTSAPSRGVTITLFIYRYRESMVPTGQKLDVYEAVRLGPTQNLSGMLSFKDGDILYKTFEMMGSYIFKVSLRTPMERQRHQPTHKTDPVYKKCRVREQSRH